MANLSEHFNNRDFVCKCPLCKGKGEFKIHLGLVGALEELWTRVGKPIRINQAYRCEEQNEKVNANKKSYHIKGKAAHIFVDNMKVQDLYKHVKEVPELKGIGLDFKDNSIHVDTRDGDVTEWVKEGDKYIPLTPDKKHIYGL